MNPRLYPSHPLVGVAALVLHQDRLLLVRRAREPALGQWSFPGGLVEAGEGLHAALAREVAEETGLRVEVGPWLGLFESIHRDERGRVRFHFVVLSYLARLLGGQARAGDDASEVAWVTREESAAMDPELRVLAEAAWSAPA